jgi:hypothetical protein
MSKIDTQIKELLTKKKKVDYINYLIDLVKNDTKCIDYEEVKTEIVSQIEPHLLKLVEQIESDGSLDTKDNKQSISQEDLQILKLLADKVKSKDSIEPKKVSNTPQQKVSNQHASTQDKMNFALNNRHLAGKRVQVMNDQNLELYGKVVGLDAPFVLIETDTGPVINVPLEKVVYNA